jgi:hypothetical protein
MFVLNNLLSDLFFSSLLPYESHCEQVTVIHFQNTSEITKFTHSCFSVPEERCFTETLRKILRPEFTTAVETMRKYATIPTRRYSGKIPLSKEYHERKGNGKRTLCVCYVRGEWNVTHHRLQSEGKQLDKDENGEPKMRMKISTR